MHSRALTAEAIGTFFVHLVLFGLWLLLAGSVVDKTLPIAFATGLTLMVVTASLGHVSGGHFNPAITIGLIAGGRFDVAHAPGFIVAQVTGATSAIALFYAAIVTRSLELQPQAITAASNGFDTNNRETLVAVLMFETIATALLVIAFMGATASRSSSAIAPLAIGAALAALYMLVIPISGGSLNPARSTGAALFAGTEALSQLWAFWLAPTLGGVLGGLLARFILNEGSRD